MFDLQSQVVLVSGAASGIGLAIADCLARAGASLYLTDIDPVAGQAAAEALIQEGLSVQFAQLDVREEAACKAMAAHILDQHGRLDVLVNNAGVGGVGTVLDTPVEELDRMYQVNVRGVFNLSSAFLPAMVAAKKGSIINLASVAGILGIVDRAAYCATKFAVVGLTKCMALDHAGEGIRVNAICPGRVETPFVMRRLQEYPNPEQAYQEMSSTQPMGRMARPEEVAAVAWFLASEAASFVTGSCQVVDGGWTAG